MIKVLTPYGKALIIGRHIDIDKNVIGLIVCISQADYLRNYPGIPFCDGTHINIVVSDDQVEPAP